mmetsp:Transcript_2362/g.9056  ORF Transcript_2362/g.9056 Transcript_2362/m.9056 type:complete len:125 (-) Transcript_2362:34-408(-)
MRSSRYAGMMTIRGVVSPPARAPAAGARRPGSAWSSFRGGVSFAVVSMSSFLLWSRPSSVASATHVLRGPLRSRDRRRAPLEVGSRLRRAESVSGVRQLVVCRQIPCFASPRATVDQCIRQYKQ